MSIHQPKSQIHSLLERLDDYHSLQHHHDIAVADAMDRIQQWQRWRMQQTHAILFAKPSTAPLADYLLYRIYHRHTFDTIAKQLHTAATHATNGTGRLEKLIPKNTLHAAILGIDATLNMIKMDLALAKYYLNHHRHQPLDETLMHSLYQAANDPEARLVQINNIGEVCRLCHRHFRSFLLQKSFKFAKFSAYKNGYQPLYDFIGEGLAAIDVIDDIDEFAATFVANETAAIRHFYDDGGKI
ncbi:hypothetical protein SAMN02745664_10966 [Moraxella cuniculi DSM 21768]|uniref:DUF8198 domain-containing protein n=1 Tax=Moraxella cuniculi DSM 21768 TaxID=1122245 RepID=A0A1N7F393_9GAMM|nr:hypothetical protein [Moraxella cuniculi]OOS05017.1 hypothetical protein B0189_07570 [Moraxella cuniculi]SIR94823.1 hypothetical protein SAMN02745664_10966 [Moraxella cuniculi DSM 21768]